jgi:uncharacterized protein (DUF1778 family)
MQVMKRKGRDLTVRLTEAQRRLLDAAARADHLDTSTWIRQLGLRRAEERAAEPERKRRIERLVAELRSGGLPDASGHAADVERSRAQEWTRANR